MQSSAVAFLVAPEGIEQVELTEPWKAVQEAGGRPELISTASGEVQAFNHLDEGDTFPVDQVVDDADADADADADVDDYAALVLPGGVANPDSLRTQPSAVAFARDFFIRQRPVAAICHAPWTLIEAQVLAGRRLTSWPSLRTDLRNAGAEWVDEEVVVDQNLTSSRNPDEVPVFGKTLVEQVAKSLRAEGFGGRSRRGERTHIRTPLAAPFPRRNDCGMHDMQSATAAARRRRHLGDFELRPDVLLVCALAVPIGAAASVLAWALLRLIGLCTNLFFSGRLDTTLVAPHNPHWWVVLGAPVLGGLIVGLMARYGSERIRGHGMPETIEAILVGGSKVAPRVAVLKPISAAVSIGSGGPFGAEGPIIMTGGALGSVIAQLLRLTADQRKTLLVAGAVAGMAATFNAPLASIMLAVELLLFEWRPRSLLPTAMAVVTATACRGPLLGTSALFGLPPANLAPQPWVLGCAALVGVSGGLLAIVATGLVYRSEDLFARLPLHWMWWPPIGGLVIGLGGLVEPRALGVGYDVIGELLHGRATLGLIVGILVVKTLIWSISLGSGTSGGVLAPTFMIGAAVGALLGQVFPPVVPGFWALLGLAAVLGGVMRCPLTGVVFSLELTGLWSALLPVVVAAAIAYLVSALVLKRSVLTEKVARRGFHLSREYSVDPLEVLFAREVMWTDVVTLDADRSLDDALAEFTSSDHVGRRDRQHRQRLYPVLRDGRLVGVASRRDLLDLAAVPGDARVVGDVMVSRPLVVHQDRTLREVAHDFAEYGVARAPVVDRDEPTTLLGLITVTQLLDGRARDLYEERVSERVLRPRPPAWARRRSLERG